MPHQRLFSTSGSLLPSPEVSLTHSVFREMLPLSPHCSLNLPDQPVPSPPLQLFFLHGGALSDRTYLRSQTPPEGWEKMGKPPGTGKTNTKKEAHLLSLSASPTLGCGINTGKYLFIATQHPNICFSLSRGHTHSCCLPRRLRSQQTRAQFCLLRPGRKEILQDLL